MSITTLLPVRTGAGYDGCFVQAISEQKARIKSITADNRVSMRYDRFASGACQEQCSTMNPHHGIDESVLDNLDPSLKLSFIITTPF